jgi:hypothetical protein
MYDESGVVIRVETVLNNPEEFPVRKHVLRKGKLQTEWVAVRKGVACLSRYLQNVGSSAREVLPIATIPHT